MIQFLTIALMCAVIGEVFTVLLTEPDQVLNGVFRFLDRKLPRWLFLPVIGCERCFTGQLAFWSWLVYNWDNYSTCVNYHMYRHMLYHMFNHMFIISSSIFLVVIIHSFYSWIKKNR